MRYRLPLAASVCCLMLALAVPSLLVAEAAHSDRAAAPDKDASLNTSQRPSGGADARGDAGANPAEPGSAAAERIKQNYGLLPLSFEANRGQADARVQFLARNSAYSLYLAADEITLALRGKTADAKQQAGRAPSGASVLRIKLLGASRRPRSHGLDELQGKSNYLIGRDPSRWHTNVPNYGKVRYEGVYPGVDVIYYGTNRQLEYDFAVAPGADANLIRLRVDGAKGPRVDANGDLVLPTDDGEVRQHAPHAYQEVAGVRRTVACRYVLRGANRVGFELGAYDRTLPLVIDPVISYSTLLGGTGYDQGNAVAVDAQGNAYVTGFTRSADFPVTPTAYQRNIRATVGDYDVFVTKLTPDGSALVYSTYLGGNYSDSGTGIAVDAAGQANVAGETASTNFPVTAGAHDTTAGGNGGVTSDVFVAKLSANGSALLYSTYLGGSGTEYDPNLALGGDGAAYVAGRTYSANFPVTPGAYQTQPRRVGQDVAEGFVAKLALTPAAGLIFSTYLGGGGDDWIDGLAVSGLDDSVYLTGHTSSFDFPTTPNAWQRVLVSDGTDFNYDAFVTRLNSAGTQVVFSTYFGGAGYEQGNAVAVDGAGAAYVAGQTSSTSLHVTPGAFQTTFVGGRETGIDEDAFVAKLSADGASVLYSTYFGGDGADRARAVAVDAQGNAYVAGVTTSSDLPAAGTGWQSARGGVSFDGFFFKLDAAGAGVPYSTYLGGSDWEQLNGLALGAPGDVYLVGETYSYDFYVKPGALQTDRRGFGDCFVTKIALGVEDYSVSGRVTNPHGSGLGDVEISLSGTVSRVVRTDADGNYRVNGLPQGAEVTLKASRLGFVFDPPEGVTLSNLSQDETVNFSGPAPLLIRGHVLNEFGGAIGLLPVTLSGSADLTTYTDYDGYYFFEVQAGGNYTVTTATDPEFTFVPPSHAVVEMTDDQTFDFTALLPPRIDGRVTEAPYDFGLRYIEVTLTGPTLEQPVVQLTDSGGYFSFENLERGATYTVTPSDAGTNRTFSPAARTITVLQGLQFVEFSSQPPLAIHGQIYAAGRDEFAGAVARLVSSDNPAGPPGLRVETPVDEWGFFAFENLPRGGDYTVTVTKPNSLYTFDPPSRTVYDLQDIQFFEFTARPPLRIIGQVADANWRGVPATVTLSGTRNETVQTDADGYYEFNDLPRGGDYTVTPSIPLYTFAPPSRSVTDIQEIQFLHFEALPPLRIFGGLTDADGRGIAGATVTLAGTVNASAVTDESGGFMFTDLPRGGNYTVTPAAHPLYNFAPPSREFQALNADEVAAFEGAPHRFTLSGRAADSAGAPVPGVTVTLGGGENGITQTDASGNYSFPNLASARAYTVTAARPGFAFAPESVNVPDPRADQTVNFTGSRLTYTISGRVTDRANGAGVAGATITLSGGRSATAQTDGQGNYAFAGLPSEGDYTLHVSHPHFSYGFPTITYHNVLSDLTGVDWSGQRINYQLGGRVTGSSGNALGGVTVTLSGAQSAATQTDSNGDYSFTNLAAGGDYSVAASLANFTFAPPSRGFANLSSNQTGDFTGTLNTHSISGRVTDAANNVLANVSVALAGSQSATTLTDAGGNYSFANLPAGGNYTVTPTLANYTFAPPSRTFSNLAANQTGDFTGTLNTHAISGRVRDSANNALGGVTVTLSGARSATAQTDAAGDYLFADLPSGFDYTLTVAKTHYAFSPPTRQLNNLGGDTTADFSAILLAHNITGRVVDSNGNGFAGALVSLTGTRTAAATTDAAGNYSFAALPAGGNYAVEPAREFYDFSPARAAFSDLGGDQTANFAAALRRFSIGGRVAEGANGVAGVTVTLGGSQTAAAQTDAAGNYLFTQLPANGSYTVTPAHPFFAFSPENASFNTLPSNRTANFAAARHLYQVSGYTLDPCGRAIPGVTMSLTHDGVTATAQTDAAGFYTFAGVPAGYNYALAPTGSTHTFNPPSAGLPALNANQAVNFTGTPPVTITDAPALADTYVRGGSATTNFGTAIQLVTRLANQTKDTHETYLKFDAGRPCLVSNVKLRVYGKLSGSGTLPAAVYAVPTTTWAETAMNWNNKPAAGALLRTVNVVGTTAAWYEWDVTDYVRGEIAAGRSNVSFVIKSTATTNYQATFNSREAAGANAPRLAVTAQ